MIIEIVTGRVHFGFPGLGPAMPFVKDGRLIALAVNTPKRSPQLPDVPSMVEIIPEYERDAAHALMAPGRTPLQSCDRSARTSRACSRWPT